MPVKFTRKGAARRSTLKIATLAALAMGSSALSAPAQAQEPDTANLGEYIVVQCSEIFGPGSPGTVVFTPSGSFNANCNPYAPSPSEVGGAIVAKCADIFGEGVSGNIVQQPNGHFKGHCR